VVETTTAAQACVELLRRENLGVATFMTLVFILLLLAERRARLLRLIVCGKRYQFFHVLCDQIFLADKIKIKANTYIRFPMQRSSGSSHYIS